MTQQYLDKKLLLKEVGEFDPSNFVAVSRDSYSDSAVLHSVKQVKGTEMLLYVALQTAIVGYGNKNFGEFSVDQESFDVEKVYRSFGVKYQLEQGAKLQPGDLTPRRLQRFFRFHIHDYLEKHPETYTYLWKKYSDNNLVYRSITFPGAESMVETEQEAHYLLTVYHELDKRLGTQIAERIKRVLIARKLIHLV